MTKSQIVAIVSKKVHLTKKATEETIDAFLDEIVRSLKKGDKVVLSAFGTFVTSQVGDKRVVPFGKQELKQIIKAHKVVNFKVGKPLKKLVW
jgi:DNA-binding protein HU-beta